MSCVAFFLTLAMTRRAMPFTTDTAAALRFVFIDRGLKLFEADGSQVYGRGFGQSFDIGCEGLEALVDCLVLF